MVIGKINIKVKWIKKLWKKLDYNKFIYVEYRVYWWSVIYVELMYKKGYWWCIILDRVNLYRNKFFWWYVISVEFMYIKNKFIDDVLLR